MNTNNTLSALKSSNILLKQHYLYPGTIFADLAPSIVTTVLDSCVSVCLWDKFRCVGGMNHFLSPNCPEQVNVFPKYGDTAIDELLKKMLQLGCRRENLMRIVVLYI